MLNTFPDTYADALDWSWADWQPHYQALLEDDLTDNNIRAWLMDWSQIARMTREVASRLSVAKDVNTTDEEAAAKYQNFMSEINPEVQKISFELNKKLVDSGIVPDGMEIPMRSIRAQIELYSEDNLPLFVKMSDLTLQYNKITGSQTVEWDGEEVTLQQLNKVLYKQDRDKREKAWRLMTERERQDRDELNTLWRELMALRKQIYQNAGLNDYREYAWKDRKRFDYTPEQAMQFCEAIEQVVVPAFEHMNEKRREKLGYDTLRPWDTSVDPLGLDPLQPYETTDEFVSTIQAIFDNVDPELGSYFTTMVNEDLLDLENRKGKRSGGYCTSFPISKRPFILMNAVGLSGDIRTLLHEAGHAFHNFSTADFDYMMAQRAPMEFNEVASMAMELLATPYLTEENGGYFSEADAARFHAEHLRGAISFLPFMACIVAFQHWVYTHHDLATDPDECDKVWLDLWGRYMKGIDYTGLEDFALNRWRQKAHVYRYPFYYIEYGLARLGSIQVFANALDDQASALKAYRDALKLGGTVTLPELYETAGAKLAFDAETLQEAVDLLEARIAAMEELVG